MKTFLIETPKGPVDVLITDQNNIYINLEAVCTRLGLDYQQHHAMLSQLGTDPAHAETLVNTTGVINTVESRLKALRADKAAAESLLKKVLDDLKQLGRDGKAAATEAATKLRESIEGLKKQISSGTHATSGNRKMVFTDAEKAAMRQRLGHMQQELEQLEKNQTQQFAAKKAQLQADQVNTKGRLGELDKEIEAAEGQLSLAKQQQKESGAHMPDWDAIGAQLLA